MNRPEIDKLVHDVLAKEPLGSLYRQVQVLKGLGVRREEVMAILEGLRSQVNEEIEDRIFEVLDFVVGFCRPQDAIWPDEES